MADVDLPIPSIDESLCNIDHPLIRQAQRLPESYEAGGVERTLALKDRIWFKVKTGRWRGVVTRLPEADQPDVSPLLRRAPWWMGAAGYRRDGDPSDFYAALAAVWTREGGSSDIWMPTDWDWKRLEVEQAFALEDQIRTTVREIIARSLRDGNPYQVEFNHYKVTALARAHGEETYLIIGTENIADSRIFSVIINSVPGIDHASWLPEPDGVAGLEPGPGEVIWSTVLPHAVAAKLLEAFLSDD
ncbi:hypothetical protein [Actinoplanes derwentensis]|nr:hypothetical protein [Actinoplanes derwentensis]